MTKQDVIAMIEKEWNAFVSLAKSFKDGDRVRAGDGFQHFESFGTLFESGIISA